MENLKRKIKPGYLYEVSSDTTSVTTSDTSAILNYIDSLSKKGINEDIVSKTIKLSNYSYNIPISDLYW